MHRPILVDAVSVARWVDAMKATALDYMVLPQILRAVADNIEREYGRA
jgi:hypothetical protein